MNRKAYLCRLFSSFRKRRDRDLIRQQSDIASVSGPSTRSFPYDNNNTSRGAETSFDNLAERHYSLQSRQTSMDALISPDSISHQLSMLSNTYENPLFGRTPVRVEQRVSFEYGDSLPLSSMSAVKNTRGVVRPNFALEPAQNPTGGMPPYAQVNRFPATTSSFSGTGTSNYNKVQLDDAASATYPVSTGAGNLNYSTVQQHEGALNKMPPYAQVNRAAKTSNTYGQLETFVNNRGEGLPYDTFQRFEVADTAFTMSTEPPDYDSLDDEKSQLKAMFRDEPDYD